MLHLAVHALLNVLEEHDRIRARENLDSAIGRLVHDPESILARGPMRFGRYRGHLFKWCLLSGFLTSALGVALVYFFMIADPIGGKDKHLLENLATVMVVLLGVAGPLLFLLSAGLLLSPGIEIRFTPLDVQFQSRAGVVHCPWSIFRTESLFYSEKYSRFILGINPLLVSVIELRRAGCIIATGQEIQTRLFHVLSDEHVQIVNPSADLANAQLAALFVTLGRRLASSLDAKAG